jgi:predicted Holliday junction resolvase-like endonuclease
LFPDFPYELSDCKFSGQPIDFIVFKNMSKVRDGEDAEIEIIIADVKS